jgi:hypothetical protein
LAASAGLDEGAGAGFWPRAVDASSTMGTAAAHGSKKSDEKSFSFMILGDPKRSKPIRKKEDFHGRLSIEHRQST